MSANQSFVRINQISIQTNTNIYSKPKKILYIDLLKIIEMAQLFQPPRTQNPSPCLPYAPVLLSHSQSATIQNLRRENLFLKQQLEAMMRNQAQKKQINKQMAIKMYCVNSEQQAQQAYKDKICRLKMKKSPRNSLQQISTIPNSPRNSMEHRNTTNNTPLNSMKVSQLINNNQNNSHITPRYLISQKNSNIIVSPRQNHLSAHQTDDPDPRLFTARKDNPSQHKKMNLAPSNLYTISQNNYQLHKVSLQAKPWRPSHQRVQTYQPQLIYLAQKTQRIQQQRKYSPISPVNNCQKLRLNSKGLNSKQQSAKNYRMSQQVQQKTHIFFEKRKQLTIENNKNIKADINKSSADHSKQPKKLKGQVQNRKDRDWSPAQGDSCLSIERNMRQEGRSTKLRYNVYMQQEVKQNL